MAKIIWMSDLHFVAEGLVQGHDPRLRLQSAITHINSHHADADFCVISGDLVNHGTVADYRALSLMLGLLSMPFYPMVGNHDNRGLLRAHLPVPKNGMADFVQYAVQMKDLGSGCIDFRCSA